MATSTVQSEKLFMNTEIRTQTGTQQIGFSKGRLWAGRIISGLVALFFLSGGINTARKAPFVMEGMAKFGYPESVALGLGLAEFICALLYVIPRTAVLGAVLLTGYLGGAVATHVRVGEPFFGALIFGVLVWLGVFLRDDRLRAFLPWRG